MEEHLKIRHMEIHKFSISGLVALHIWVSPPKEGQQSVPPQHRFVLPYSVAVELGTQLASVAERLQGEDFSP